MSAGPGRPKQARTAVREDKGTPVSAERQLPSLAGSTPAPLGLKEFADLMGLAPDALLAHLAPAELLRLPGGRRGVARVAAARLVRAALATGGSEAHPDVIAFCNLKGGVGKTTLVIQLAARAAQCGLRVCVLDMDPQASSTLALVGEPADGQPLFIDVWQQPERLLQGALLPVVEGLDMLPSALDNTLLDSQLAHPAQQKRAVRGVCEQLASLGYDLVLIDCPPTLGTAVISTLCAVRQLVIPLCADAFSLKGLRLTLEELGAICDAFALPEPPVRLVFNRHDGRERLHAQTLEALRVSQGTRVMQAVLRVSSQYARALAAGLSVYGPPRQPVAAADMDHCLRELLRINT
jgi:chromosome partitioning protein